jgi:hypothetical protein
MKAKQLTFFLGATLSAVFVPAQADDFKPLPRVPPFAQAERQTDVAHPLGRTPSNPRITVGSPPQEPKEKFIPLANLAFSVPGMTGGDPHQIPSKDADKLQAAIEQWQAYMTNQAATIQFQQLQTVIRLANQQTSVRAKVEAARKEVQDYIRLHSPELMPLFEKMNEARVLERKNGQLTEAVF